MRYIKLYEEFEPSKSVKDNIRDIFIELTDKDFNVIIDDWGNIKISTGDRSPFVCDSEMIEMILRLIDYLNMNRLYLNEIEVHIFNQTTIFISNINSKGLYFYYAGEKNKVEEPLNYIKMKYSNKNL